MSFVLDSNGTTDRMTVNIKLAGLPPMMLSVGDPIESWRWKFAIISSYKFARDPTNHFDMYEHRSDIDKLYNELSSSTVKLYHQKMAAVAPGPVTTTGTGTGTSSLSVNTNNITPCNSTDNSDATSMPSSARLSETSELSTNTITNSNTGGGGGGGVQRLDSVDADPHRGISTTRGHGHGHPGSPSPKKKKNVWLKVMKDRATEKSADKTASSTGLKVLGNSRGRATNAKPTSQSSE